MSENNYNPNDRMSFTEVYNTARNIDYIKTIHGTATPEEQEQINARAMGEIKVCLVFFAIFGIIVLLSKFGII